MIPAGTLNRRITLLTPIVSINALGEEEHGWQVVAEVWACRLGLRLAEVNRMAGTVQAAEAKYRVRHRADITPAMRLQEGALTYEITSVEEVGVRQALNLFVRAA